MTIRISTCVFVFLATALSGCQQLSPAQALQPQQLNQLSALVAGSNWTRDYCQRSDIPDQQTLMRGALGQAKNRGWNTAQIDPHELSNAINQRYAALTKDHQTNAQKCAALNVAIAPFLNQMSWVRS
ncbi:type II secretion system pilot lipoprotein GspS [Pantoea sp. JK]|uniref:type II secretion system pilot lipoprotein GspS n=1 Tax=Pantoea sp. JK TaxID=2871703 RepID=UPI0022389E7C|nr:type II secretion system pilot lipoprotein GspS [Pantoea sp. JK]MCW6031375.1 type II secretion system pilot lipoprotein GspS [Pantoea sp. JK]